MFLLLKVDVVFSHVTDFADLKLAQLIGPINCFLSEVKYQNVRYHLKRKFYMMDVSLVGKLIYFYKIVFLSIFHPRRRLHTFQRGLSASMLKILLKCFMDVQA